MQLFVGNFNMKSRIIEQLGPTDILVPSLIAEGLAAKKTIAALMSDCH